jgi:RNA polymerase sigma factor (sigma-70 family)
VTVDLENVFEAERQRLTVTAARILDSEHDAYDVLQLAWLRLSRSDTSEIDEMAAWLTRVVTRLCLDHLRKRATREDAESMTSVDSSPVDPADDSLIGEQVREAMHAVMDTLAPAERVAFVLHDVFGYPFDDVSALLGRSGTAVRQLASRARRKLQGAPEPNDVRATRDEHRIPDGSTRR